MPVLKLCWNMEYYHAFEFIILFLCFVGFLQSTRSELSQQNPNTTDFMDNESRRFHLDISENETATKLLNSTVLETHISYLPPYWNDFCTLQNITQESVDLYSYFCHINTSTSGRWNFTELRSYIKSKNVKYIFDVRCKDNASISLPRNAKGKNILKLFVRDCVATDYYADFQNPELDFYPDELEEYVLINVNHLISVIAMGHSLLKNIDSLPKNVECGDDETLKIKMERNITFAFKDDDDDNTESLRLLETMSSKNIIEKRMSSQKCNFKNLRLLDLSVSSSKMRFYAEMLTEQNRFPVLQVLNISHSKIYYIPAQFKYWWIYFPKLEYLDMSYNRIQDINFNTVETINHQVPRLTFDFTSNNISRLSVSILERIIHIKNVFIKLANNPFNCTCTDEMKDIMKYIHETDWKSEKYQRYEYLKDLECYFPENVRGRRLKDLTARDIRCEFELMPITVSLCVLSSVLLVFIIVMLKYRREIRILFFTRFNFILPCQPLPISDDRDFDAFVSYSSDDQEWVHDMFDISKHKRLEHLKFCMHHKDFVPGKTIFENILKCVENSKHTIIILSRNFLDSHFCMWEFQEAFQHSILERKRHLILLLLEDIPEEELPNDLKRCMKTFTYIRKDDNIFIDRLLYSLTYSSKKAEPKLMYENKSFDDGEKIDSFRGKNLKQVETK